MKLVILSNMVIPEVAEAELQAVEAIAREAGLEVAVAGTREAQLVAVRDAEVAFGGITEEVFQQAPRLRWIQSVGAGMGGTGVEVARRAAAFGMRVIATDPEPVEQPPFVAALWTPGRFHDLLRESDVVVITCPSTAETRGMLDEAAFRAMRRHAILVN